MQLREMPGTWQENSCQDSSPKLLISSGESVCDLSPVVNSWSSMHSLGISMLEIACDLELPSGGLNWHLLRDGTLPQEFTQGMQCKVSSLLPQCLLLLAGLSPQLTQLLSQMMHPHPEERPTANQLLGHWRVRRALWRGHLRRTAHRLVSLLLREGEKLDCSSLLCRCVSFCG